MIDVVVPTIGRPSLRALLDTLARAAGPRPARVILVDDRRDRNAPLDLAGLDPDLAARVTVLAGKAAGPAAARNTGWRASRAEWVAFVDDDVLLGATWLADLERDLRDLPPGVAGSQARVSVPLPAARKPTDWERNVAGLATSQWITADCAYRRADLLAAGGFDERFPRAYREDADLALRIVARGKRIVRGERRTAHPVRPADWKISLRLQAGNADDVLMDALHGADWRARAAAPRGAYPAHVAAVATAALALAALGARKRRLGVLLGAAWAVQAGRFAWRRIAPGPRTPAEVRGLLATSVAIPFAAVYHRLRGHARLRALLADAARAPQPLPRAVLFDRDGTLVADVPYNGDPARVEPMPGARAALARLRAAGVATAVVSNQSGVALGRITPRRRGRGQRPRRRAARPAGPGARLHPRAGRRLPLPQARARPDRGRRARARRRAGRLRGGRRHRRRRRRRARRGRPRDPRPDPDHPPSRDRRRPPRRPRLAAKPLISS